MRACMRIYNTSNILRRMLPSSAWLCHVQHTCPAPLSSPIPLLPPRRLPRDLTYPLLPLILPSPLPASPSPRLPGVR